MKQKTYIYISSLPTQVFFDIAIGDEEVGRIVIGLFGGTVPDTVKNFKQLAENPQGEGWARTSQQYEYIPWISNDFLFVFSMRSGTKAVSSIAWSRISWSKVVTSHEVNSNKHPLFPINFIDMTQNYCKRLQAMALVVVQSGARNSPTRTSSSSITVLAGWAWQMLEKTLMAHNSSLQLCKRNGWMANTLFLAKLRRVWMWFVKSNKLKQINVIAHWSQSQSRIPVHCQSQSHTLWTRRLAMNCDSSMHCLPLFLQLFSILLSVAFTKTNVKE